MRTIHSVFCLAVVGVCTLAACRSRAQVEVDWDSLSGFYTDAITINAGDEVDFVNVDPFDVPVDFIGDPPESFSVNVPPGYFFPYVYNNPGVFTVSDDVTFTTVTITVQAVVLPDVVITDPSSNAVFIAPATFPITAVPSSGATPYSDVQFLVGTNDAGDIFSSPFTTTVTNLPVGSYVLSAIVTDFNFNMATNTIPITVVPPPRLAARQAGNQLIVSWTTNIPSGLSLKWATNLQSSATWNAVGQTPGIVGTNWVVTNSITKTNTYFRLSSP